MTKSPQTPRSKRAQRAKGTPFAVLYKKPKPKRSRSSTASAAPAAAAKPKADQSYRARTLACLEDI